MLFLILHCISYRAKEWQYKKEISEIFEVDLCALMSMVNNSRHKPTRLQHGRHKRFVSVVFGMLFDVVNAFVN